MPDDQLDILISLQADLGGATESLAALKELKRQAVATGVSTGDLDKQIAVAERTTAGFQKKVEDAGKKGTVHIRGLEKAVGFLGRQFGELGQLVTHFAMSWQALGLAAAGFGLSVVVDHFAKLAQKVKESQAELEKLNLAKVNQLRDATAAAAEAMYRYNVEVSRASESKDVFAGRKFASEKEELAARMGKRETLGRTAMDAKAAAENLLREPEYVAAVSELAAAKAKEGKLKAAANATGTVEFRRAQFERYRGTQGGAFAQQKYAEAVAAHGAFSENASVIARNQSVVSGYANRLAGMESYAGAAVGLNLANESRIGALRDSTAEAERQRREDLTGRFRDAGFGFASQRLAGAGQAVVNNAQGGRASESDAKDFNILMGLLQITKQREAAYRKLLIEVFRDGVVTPEELEKLSQVVKNKSRSR